MVFKPSTHTFRFYKHVLALLWCLAVVQLFAMLFYPDKLPWLSLISRYTVSLGNTTCLINSTKLVGPVKVSLEKVTEEEISSFNPGLKPGGRFRPRECISQHKVAVIVPFRDRHEHLRIFLHNLHPFLQRQQLDYGIFVVEQSSQAKFNRGTLLNVGYLEARKTYKYDCFIFHDVDLLPENDRNLYSCASQPRHMSVAIDKYDYIMPYKTIFGGVSAFSDKQFAAINGFPNVYWGWGGEDDDLWLRVLAKGFNVSRYPAELARYKMIKHGSDPSNPRNPHRYELLGYAAKRFSTDGLSNVVYKVLDMKLKSLYTLLVVEIVAPSKVNVHVATSPSQTTQRLDVAG